MGVAITDLLVRKEIELKELANKKIIIDAPLYLYQFLSSIRQQDGSLLTDSNGQVTSHLTGIFYRSIKLMEQGLKIAYSFDGTPPELKKAERDRRRELKKAAELKYEEAAKKKDLVEMKKYAARTTRLTKDMIEESKELLKAFGLPVIEAPSEAEAQASYIVKKGDAYAVGTNDADALLFSSPKLIKNLNVVGKRKKTSKLAYETTKPELIDLADTLNSLGIDNDQLIVLSMLVGTDYDPGVKGIGPKNALKLVKEHKKDFDSLFQKVKWDDFSDHPWTEVFYLIKKMPVTDNYSLDWKEIDKEKIKKILVDKHDFSEERITTTLKRLEGENEKRKQKSLADF